MRAPTRRVRRAVAAALALGALATSVAPATAETNRTAFPVVVAYNFGFAGVPDDVDTGKYDFTFVNASHDQAHEIIFFKMAEDREEDSRRQVIKALDKNDFSLVDGRPAGFAIAEPTEISASRVNFKEEGRYLYVCFFTDPATGLPHYKLDPGMLGFVDAE